MPTPSDRDGLAPDGRVPGGAVPPAEVRAIAHDLTNLLGVIRNHALLAERGVEDPEVRADLAQVCVAAEQAAHLCRQLLGSSALDGEAVLPSSEVGR